MMRYSEFKARMRKEAYPWGTRSGKPVKGARQKAREQAAERQRIAAEDAAAKAAEGQRLERNGDARRQAEAKAREEGMRNASAAFRQRYGMEMPGWYMGYMSNKYGNGMPAGFNPYDVWSHPQLTADDYRSYMSSSRAGYDRMLAEGRLTAGQHSMLSGQLDGMDQGMPEVEDRLSRAMQPWQRPAEVVRPTPGSTVANLRERQKYNSGYTALQQFSAADPLSAAVAAPFIMASQGPAYVVGDAVSHLAPGQQRKALEYSRLNGGNYLGYNPHRSLLANGLAAGADFMGNTALGLYDMFMRPVAGKIGAGRLNGFMTNLRDTYNARNIRALGDFAGQAVTDGRVSPGTADAAMGIYGNPAVRDTAANLAAVASGSTALSPLVEAAHFPYAVYLGNGLKYASGLLPSVKWLPKLHEAYSAGKGVAGAAKAAYRVSDAINAGGALGRGTAASDAASCVSDGLRALRLCADPDWLLTDASLGMRRARRQARAKAKAGGAQKAGFSPVGFAMDPLGTLDAALEGSAYDMQPAEAGEAAQASAY